ncbi:MAG: IS66 family insertion sequence element accessory protein TnpB [Sphingomonas bacterium]|nr:IS66 family insertion sequence element accessory protein TnpB [Sphingomonas bacterium]
MWPHFGKQLERGRFVWPSPADGTVTISPAQLGYLLEGIDWRHPQRTLRRVRLDSSEALHCRGRFIRRRGAFSARACWR